MMGKPDLLKNRWLLISRRWLQNNATLRYADGFLALNTFYQTFNIQLCVLHQVFFRRMQCLDDFIIHRLLQVVLPVGK
ncbi:MAG: hypothetical protein A2535_09985 [Burkholderiales bacterium RIFOXYD2_FULL_59_8]|nr:MAG: hypothetical protein A2535_09985 [Burkholderiales bacterium RIFOXYD2_FULL_59_8]